MLTDTERLIEAITYADDYGMEWWEVFDTKTEASDILNGALKEKPDDYDIVQLLNLIDEDDLFTETPLVVFKNCLTTLKRRMNRNC